MALVLEMQSYMVSQTVYNPIYLLVGFSLINPFSFWTSGDKFPFTNRRLGVYLYVEFLYLYF